MANYYSIPNSFTRDGQYPLDESFVRQTLTALQTYIQSDASCYNGQIIAVVNDGANNGLYRVTNAGNSNGYSKLAEVASIDADQVYPITLESVESSGQITYSVNKEVAEVNAAYAANKDLVLRTATGLYYTLFAVDPNQCYIFASMSNDCVFETVYLNIEGTAPDFVFEVTKSTTNLATTALATPYVDAQNPGSSGLMSAADKGKLDALPTNAQLTTALGEKANAVDVVSDIHIDSESQTATEDVTVVLENSDGRTVDSTIIPTASASAAGVMSVDMYDKLSQLPAPTDAATKDDIEAAIKELANFLGTSNAANQTAFVSWLGTLNEAGADKNDYVYWKTTDAGTKEIVYKMYKYVETPASGTTALADHWVHAFDFDTDFIFPANQPGIPTAIGGLPAGYEPSNKSLVNIMSDMLYPEYAPQWIAASLVFKYNNSEGPILISVGDDAPTTVNSDYTIQVAPADALWGTGNNEHATGGTGTTTLSGSGGSVSGNVITGRGKTYITATTAFAAGTDAVKSNKLNNTNKTAANLNTTLLSEAAVNSKIDGSSYVIKADSVQKVIEFHACYPVFINGTEQSLSYTATSYSADLPAIASGSSITFACPTSYTNKTIEYYDNVAQQWVNITALCTSATANKNIGTNSYAVSYTTFTYSEVVGARKYRISFTIA